MGGGRVCDPETDVSTHLLRVSTATVALRPFGGSSSLFLCLRLEVSDYQRADWIIMLFYLKEEGKKKAVGKQGLEMPGGVMSRVIWSMMSVHLKTVENKPNRDPQCA